MKSQKKRLASFWVVLPVVAALVFTIMIGTMSIRNIQRIQYEERVNSANVLMEKISQNVSTAVTFNWDKIHGVKAMIQEKPYKSIAEIQAVLADYTRSTVNEYWLIDSSGWTLTGDGDSFLWKEQDQLLGTADSFVAGDHQAGFDNAMRDYYLTRFDTPVIVDDKTFTHLILVSSMRDLDPFFEVSNYGENSITFIIRNNGVQMYRQERNSQLSGVYNILSALEQAVFMEGGSLEQMQQEISEGIRNTLSLQYNEVVYYVSYAPLEIEGLTALLFVPEENISGGTHSFTFSIVSNVGVVFLSTLLLVVLTILLATQRTRQAQKLAVEAEHNANQAKTDFLSSMSHDIRTPMNAIVGMADMAAKRSDDPVFVQSCVEKIRQASQHLLTLINDVLDISKIESREMALSPDNFSLSEMIENLETINRPQANERHHHLVIRTHNITHDALYGDRLRLDQICINILSNAIKYTENGGEIFVDFYESSGSETDTILLRYVVQDNGMGISDEFQKKMYETFARAEDSRINKVAGTGLGLAIVKQMVGLMGGTIECKSALGEGTTFDITLPFRIGRQPEKVVDTAEEAGTAELKKMHLLVAEDNDMNWELMVTYLEMYGATAERAENGKICVEMMEAANQGKYTAILMDVRMPVMNGYEATKRIRKSNKAWVRNIPIIAVTADAFAEDIRLCMEAGMNDHVPRPVDFDKLFEKLAICTKNSEAHGTWPIRRI